jgi:hypothetical protein
MRKQIFPVLTFLLATVAVIFSFSAANRPQAQYEFKIVTSIESVIPAGLGRSRLITSDARGKLEEDKLKNFFSITGINFGNIVENDQKISSKLGLMYAEGWELYDIVSGVYGSSAPGEVGGSNTGIFIIRYLFRKEK